MSSVDKVLIDKLEAALSNNLAKSFVEAKALGVKASEVELSLGRSKVYDQKFRSLVNTFERKKGKTFKSEKKSLVDFGTWLAEEHRLTLSPNSWSLYKAALKAIVLDQDFVDLIDVPPANQKRDVTKKSSAKRVKYLPDETLAKIIAKINITESKYSDVCCRLLFIVRKFGIRPAEIMNCEIIQYKGFYFFKVKSLKMENHFYQNSIVTTEYPYRYVPTLHLSDGEVEYVKQTITSFSQIQSKDIFDNLYEKIRQLFFDTCLKLNLNADDKSFSIYSARQQFSCDLKASPLKSKTKSMIMSHQNEETLRHHYGKKVNGKALLKPNQNYENILLECFSLQI